MAKQKRTREQKEIARLRAHIEALKSQLPKGARASEVTTLKEERGPIQSPEIAKSQDSKPAGDKNQTDWEAKYLAHDFRKVFILSSIAVSIILALKFLLPKLSFVPFY